jgi:hypothetical protein
MIIEGANKSMFLRYCAQLLPLAAKSVQAQERNSNNGNDGSKYHSS